MGDVLLYSSACSNGTVEEIDIIALMLSHDEIGAITNIQNTSYRSCENGHSSFVVVGQLFGGDQHQAHEEYGYDDKSHIGLFFTIQLLLRCKVRKKLANKQVFFHFFYEETGENRKL